MAGKSKSSALMANKLLPVVVGLGLLAVLVVYLLVSNRAGTVTTYAECITSKDAKILETYPLQCEKDGKIFVDDTAPGVDDSETLCAEGDCGELDEEYVEPSSSEISEIDTESGQAGSQ